MRNKTTRNGTARGVKTRAAVLGLIFGLLFANAGCQNDEGEDGVVERYALEIYYVNGEYIDKGDESKGRLIGPVKSSLSMDGRDGENEYFALLNDVLREDPPDEISDAALTMVYDTIAFRGASVEDGTAYVDMSSEGPAGEPLSGGSLEESLLIQQITFSLIDSFDEVKRVQFMIDGEIRETMMGHVDTSVPFDKESFS